MSGLFGFGLVLASVVAGGPAGPAHGAQGEPSPFSVQIDRPTAGTTLTGSAAVSVAGKVVATGIGASLDRIRLQVVREADGETVVDTNLCCDSPKAGDVAFGPLTTPTLAYNGPYRLTVTATGYYDILITRSPAPPASASRSFSVAVPADAPTGLKAQLVGDRNVQLTWNPPSYPPDFIGFAVFRATGGGSFEPLRGLSKGETTFTDTSVANVVGAVQYQVASVRQGAEPGNDTSKWLVSRSDAAGVTLPPLPTTVPPGASTTTTAPGGGLQQDGAASADLGSFFSSVPTLELPPPSPPPTFPDTGFSELLPFPSTTAAPDGTQAGRPSIRTPVSSADDEFTETEEPGSTNRRALLVPVAAGSVLCVAALHLRWLNKRLEFVPPPDGPGGAGGDFELAEPDDDDFLPLQPREPVGAGARGGGRPG